MSLTGKAASNDQLLGNVSASKQIQGSVSANEQFQGAVPASKLFQGKINGLDVIYIDTYQIAVRNGFRGTVDEWLALLKGTPPGGKAGQILCKKSDDDYDVEWADFKIPEQYGLVTYDQDKAITIT